MSKTIIESRGDQKASRGKQEKKKKRKVKIPKGSYLDRMMRIFR